MLKGTLYPKALRPVRPHAATLLCLGLGAKHSVIFGHAQAKITRYWVSEKIVDVRLSLRTKTTWFISGKHRGRSVKAMPKIRIREWLVTLGVRQDAKPGLLGDCRAVASHPDAQGTLRHQGKTPTVLMCRERRVEVWVEGRAHQRTRVQVSRVIFQS